MAPFSILVAQTEQDICAELIAQHVISDADSQLFAGRVVELHEIGALIEGAKESPPSAVIIVGDAPGLDDVCMGLLSGYRHLVLVRVATIGDMVRFDVRNVSLHTPIAAARRLAEYPDRTPEQRIARFHLSAGGGSAAPEPPDQGASRPEPERLVVCAIVKWLHALLTRAVVRQCEQLTSPDEPPQQDPLEEPSADVPREFPGMALSASAVERALRSPGPCETPEPDEAVERLEREFFARLDAAQPTTEPFAALYRALRLTPLEFKAFLIALASEFDVRYQRSFGLLLDEMGRRGTTIPLIASLLGEPTAVRRKLAATNALARWRLFETDLTHSLAADEPVRVDAALVGWLFGSHSGLRADARLAQVLLLDPWPGANLLRTKRDQDRAARIAERLRANHRPYWMVLGGEDLPGWRALIELAARLNEFSIARVSLPKLEALDRHELSDVIVRLTRLIRLTNIVPVVDFAQSDTPARADQVMRRVASAVISAGAHAALITPEPERCLPLLGPVETRLFDKTALDTPSRQAMLCAVAEDLGAPLSAHEAASLSAAFPLAADGIDCAARLALATARHGDSLGELHRKLRAACRRAASQHVSRLVQRLDPRFDLDDVKLSLDRRRQLDEIVANIRLSTKVLDDWKFASQLPYGRGVTALFHGPSGTGKTMAAQAIAKELCIEVFVVDLSRVTSKYIGESEKNLDVVFTEAQRSGAMLLLDEAEALFGKRSEVKDAHDRYANMEIAFLLQRMESFSGLAILTTNLRQNLDQAFLRRLRFVVDFPKPDAEAREQIWRLCLLEGTHELSDADFRLLARKVDLTGGSIRQISVRAAFIAAADAAKCEKIQMRHVIDAARSELAKLGMPTPVLEVPAQQAASAKAVA